MVDIAETCQMSGIVAILFCGIFQVNLQLNQCSSSVKYYLKNIRLEDMEMPFRPNKIDYNAKEGIWKIEWGGGGGGGREPIGRYKKAWASSLGLACFSPCGFIRDYFDCRLITRSTTCPWNPSCGPNSCSSCLTSSWRTSSSPTSGSACSPSGQQAHRKGTVA